MTTINAIVIETSTAVWRGYLDRHHERQQWNGNESLAEPESRTNQRRDEQDQDHMNRHPVRRHRSL
jgi:hypothetical protein